MVLRVQICANKCQIVPLCLEIQGSSGFWLFEVRAAVCCSIIYMPQTHWKKTWTGNDKPTGHSVWRDNDWCDHTDSHIFTGYFLKCSVGLSFTYTPHLAHTNYLLTMCPGTPSQKNQITATMMLTRTKKNKKKPDCLCKTNPWSSVLIIYD